jgi:hypothetical protein
MATMTVCDSCSGCPTDYSAASGGDVRRIRLTIEGVKHPQIPGPAESREFDACAACRLRLFGEVLENIAPKPPIYTWEKLAKSDALCGDGSDLRGAVFQTQEEAQAYREGRTNA